MPLALSQDERILLHLARHQRFREEWEVPAEACQEGIGTRLGILVNNVSRALAGLLGEGLVEERLAHVRGRPRRLKAYFLTEKGLRTVEQVERRLRAAKVDVELEGTRKEVALGAVEEHVVRVVGRRPDLLALADAVREGKTRDADLRAATGGEVAPARPTFAESLAGMPTVERFVGRTAELAAIASALEDRGRAAVVLWGMAGIGKSTLAARAVELRRGRAHLLWHRCTEWDTFRGLVAAVSGLLQESGRTRLAAARRQRWSGQSELLAPLVADFRELPLVLVFDDVHRLPADAAPFLAIALEAARNSSTHVVLVSRTLPAVYGRGDAAPGGPVVEVEVGHLTAEEARSLLPDLSPEDYVRLYAASRGHPLFLRLLASGGAVTEDLTRFIELEIYEKLSDAERAILRALSVHRLPAGFDALEGASPDALVPLKGRGLVHETSGRLELHDLVRDFVYSRLPREARLALHAAAAKYWEAAEPAEALHHRLQAEDWEGGARLALDVISALAEDNPREAATLLGPLTRERVPADLWPDVLYLHGFAQERVGEARAALETYGEVLRLEEARGGDKASLAILHQHIAQLKREFATFDEALQSHRSALRLFQEAGDREGAALELANVAALHRRRGDLAKARESLATALEAATKAQAPRAVAAVHYQGALVAVDSGDLGTAASRFRDAEREARAGADPAGAVLAKAGLLEVEFLRGNRTRAAQIAAELSALVPDDPTSRSAREGLMGFASLLGAAGEPEEALRYTFEASRRPTSRILHRPAPEAVDLEAASLAASLCRRLARWKEMVAQRDEAVRLAWALGRPARVGRELLERAIDAESRGDLDRALVALQESTKVLASAGSARGLAAAHLTWGRVLEKRDDPQAAEVHYEEAVRHAEAAADLLGQARALEVLGEVAGPRGRDSLRRARVIYAQLGRAADEARVVRLLAP